MESVDQVRILVVDDTAATRYAVARVVRAAGFMVIEAATGSEALELAGQADAVLLDVFLPDISGLEVCRLLRTRPDTQAMPIIHMSAIFVGEADSEFAQTAGADAYLINPIPPEVLIRVLQSALAARAALATIPEGLASI